MTAAHRFRLKLFLDQAHWQELAGTLTPGVVVSNRELRWRRDDGAPLKVLATLREADGFFEGVAIAAATSPSAEPEPNRTFGDPL